MNALNPSLPLILFQLARKLTHILFALVLRTILLLILPFLTPGFASSTEEGFVQIFNGTDLAGWDGMPGAWSVRDGAIESLGAKLGKNWLIWRGAEVKEFELRLRFRFIRGNSGVQVRSHDLGNWQVHGYQVEIAAREKMGLWHESLWREKERTTLATAGQKVHIAPDGSRTVAVFADPAKLQAAVKINDWNKLIVIGEGNRLVQIINGVVLAELIDEDRTRSKRSGVIALQDHGNGCLVQYRDIRLKVTH